MGHALVRHAEKIKKVGLLKTSILYCFSLMILCFIPKQMPKITLYHMIHIINYDATHYKQTKIKNKQSSIVGTKRVLLR